MTLPCSSKIGCSIKSISISSPSVTRAMVSKREGTPCLALLMARRISCCTFSSWAHQYVCSKGKPITSLSFKDADNNAVLLASRKIPSGVITPINTAKRSSTSVMILPLLSVLSSLGFSLNAACFSWRERCVSKTLNVVLRHKNHTPCNENADRKA